MGIMKRLLSMLTCGTVFLGLLLGEARGQAAPPRGDSQSDAERSDRVPAFQYTLAFLFTILVLTIICMPSRKPAND